MQILPPKIFFFVLSPTSCPFCSPADEYPWWLWHASGWVVCCLSLWLLGSIRFLRRMLFLSQNNTSLFPSMCPKKDKIIIHFPCVLWVDFHGMSYSGIGIFLFCLYITWPVYLKQDISISVHGWCWSVEVLGRDHCSMNLQLALYAAQKDLRCICMHGACLRNLRYLACWIYFLSIIFNKYCATEIYGLYDMSIIFLYHIFEKLFYFVQILCARSIARAFT